MPGIGIGAALLGGRIGIALRGNTPADEGVPVLAWRFSNNLPVLKQGGGYWLRAS